MAAKQATQASLPSWLYTKVLSLAAAGCVIPTSDQILDGRVLGAVKVRNELFGSLISSVVRTGRPGRLPKYYSRH